MVQILVPTEQRSLVCTPNKEKKSTKALFLHFYKNKAFCSSSVSESRHAQANNNRLNSKPSIGANQPGRKSGNKTLINIRTLFFSFVTTDGTAIST